MLTLQHKLGTKRIVNRPRNETVVKCIGKLVWRYGEDASRVGAQAGV